MTPETAFILAAGLGTRMRPLTDDRPKALVEVAGRALIDHMLDRLRDAGAKRFVVNVHYFADRLEAHLKARSDLDIIVSDERAALLETGGGLKQARPLLGEDAIWVANIDSVWLESDPDGTALKALSDQWNPNEMDAALLVTPMETSHGFDGAGDFFLSDGRLTFRGEAAAAPFNYMGVHITKPQIVDAEPDGAFSLSRLWRQLAPQGRLHGTVFNGEWMHVGDPAARDYAEGRLA